MLSALIIIALIPLEVIESIQKVPVPKLCLVYSVVNFFGALLARGKSGGESTAKARSRNQHQHLVAREHYCLCHCGLQSSLEGGELLLSILFFFLDVRDRRQRVTYIVVRVVVGSISESNRGTARGYVLRRQGRGTLRSLEGLARAEALSDLASLVWSHPKTPVAVVIVDGTVDIVGAINLIARKLGLLSLLVHARVDDVSESLRVHSLQTGETVLEATIGSLGVFLGLVLFGLLFGLLRSLIQWKTHYDTVLA